jgi:phasin family protein
MLHRNIRSPRSGARGSEEFDMPPKAKKVTVVRAEGGVPEPAATASWAPLFAPMNLESLADLGRENIEAMAKANIALSEGLQAIGDEILTYAKSSLENASHTATKLLGAKTLDEVIQLNSALAKASLETLVARSAKLSEMGVSVANEALAPLGGRFEATFVKLTKQAAA